MRPPVFGRWSRRQAMYALVAVQLALLAGIVGLRELNRALDSGPGVNLEMSRAEARTDPFRGASVNGRLALDLDGPAVAMPVPRLEPGERVLLFFTPRKDQQPEITAVTRRTLRADPRFGNDSFSIPGTVVRDDGTRSLSTGSEPLIAHVGKPPTHVALDLPGSIPIDDSLARRLIGPSIVQASLRGGALGYRYFAGVKITGEGWGPQASVTYDARHERLIVFASREEGPDRRPFASQRPPRSGMYVFDATGQEIRRVEIPGRIIEGAVNPVDGGFLALVSEEAWGYGPASMTRLGEDGTVLQRGPQVVYERVLGSDVDGGGLWVLAGAPTASLRAPYFIERMTLGGTQGERLGPFPSRPRMVLPARKALWVLEPDRHCITRMDRAGRIEREYEGLNRPTDLAVDGEGFVAIEGSQTQLSRYTIDGRVVWRMGRFQGLAWIIPDAAGGGWVGAASFGEQPGGIFRYHADGRVSRLPATVSIRSAEWSRSRLAPEAVRDAALGRFYVREAVAVVILAPDSTLIRRLEGFRYPNPSSPKE